MGLLENSANSFVRLKKIEYRIVLSSGRNKPLENIIVNFCDEDLFHILGLQHLKDIELSKNKKVIISQIQSGIITDDYISKSDYYDNPELEFNIKKRIIMASFLEELFDSDIFTISIYKMQHDNRTNIKADYLITCKRYSSDVSVKPCAFCNLVLFDRL
ncbi:MAG: hypothetical protein J6M65_07905 [Eubacterium sp.]|nr:hypothetical protein [Eubacterium sp.]